MKHLRFGIVAAVLVAVAAAPLGLGSYWLQLTTVVVLYALSAAALDLIYGYTGMLSLGHAAFFGIGAYSAALIPDWVAVPGIVTILIGALLAAIAGAVVAWIGVRVPQYFAIITLAATLIIFSLVVGSDLTGGPTGRAGVSRDLFGTGALTLEALYLISTTMLVIFLVGMRNLRRSRTGRALETIRTQPRTAQALGVDVNAVQIRTFMIGAAVAAVAGGFFASVLRFVSPEFVGITQSIQSLVMVVIGGLGTGWGAIIGAGIIRGLPEVVQALRDWQLVMIGLLTLIVLVRFQLGVAGTIEKFVRSRKPHVVPERPKREAADVEHSDDRSVEQGEPLLTLTGVSRQFGGLQALGDVDLDVRAGELHALVGPNGAGKSTLVNCVTGIDRPTAGRVHWAGTDVTSAPPHKKARLGMSRTFQLLGLSPKLTVLENVMLGGHLRSTSGFFRGAVAWLRKPEEERLRAEAIDVLDRLGLLELAHRYPSEIAVGQQRLVEVGRCLMSRAELLLLDEPAAGLNETETVALGARLREIVANGTAILLIEHDMRLVMEISDRVSVLVFGKRITTGTPDEVSSNDEVIASYLGTPRTTDDKEQA